MTTFHSTEPPWFGAAQALKPGGRVRHSDSGIISFNGRAYHRWDFREKESEVYEPQLTLAQRLANNAMLEEANLQAAKYSATMPMPAMQNPQDWPSAARVWMHKAHLSNDDIINMGAYWNPDMQRVILPLTSLKGDRYWIGRDVSPGAKLKYLFPEGVNRGGGALFSLHEAPTSAVVIVEDVLSAYRIMRDTGLDTIAANGTSLDRGAMTFIAAQYLDAAVWLDPDAYGQLGADKIRRQLGQLGVSSYSVLSKRDPKLLDPTELRERLAV